MRPASEEETHGGRVSDVHRRRVGELVGRTDPRRDQPGDRRGARHRAGGHEGGREQGRRGRQEGVRGGLVRLHAEGSAARPAQVRGSDRGARRRDREARGPERRQAGRRDALGGDPADRRQPPVLRRRRADDGGPQRRGVHGRVHELRPSRADRRRGADRAVELPADDGDLEDRTRPRDREHDRPQALRDDAADGAEARGADRRHPAARRVQRRHRRRRPRRATRSCGTPTWASCPSPATPPPAS